MATTVHTHITMLDDPTRFSPGNTWTYEVRHPLDTFKVEIYVYSPGGEDATMDCQVVAYNKEIVIINARRSLRGYKVKVVSMDAVPPTSNPTMSSWEKDITIGDLMSAKVMGTTGYYIELNHHLGTTDVSVTLTQPGSGVHYPSEMYVVLPASDSEVRLVAVPPSETPGLVGWQATVRKNDMKSFFSPILTPEEQASLDAIDNSRVTGTPVKGSQPQLISRGDMSGVAGDLKKIVDAPKPPKHLHEKLKAILDELESVERRDYTNNLMLLMKPCPYDHCEDGRVRYDETSRDGIRTSGTRSCPVCDGLGHVEEWFRKVDGPDWSLGELNKLYHGMAKCLPGLNPVAFGDQQLKLVLDMLFGDGS